MKRQPNVFELETRSLQALCLALVQAQNQTIMRALVGILVTAAVALGIYYFYLKGLPASDHGTVATQSISLTGVKNDLIAIAQAERLYVAQNGSCASIDALTSTGALSVTKAGRDGYTYEVDCAGANFKVTATHPPAPTGTPSIHYPGMSIDQTMEIHQSN